VDSSRIRDDMLRRMISESSELLKSLGRRSIFFPIAMEIRFYF
jgi:hypothetical protein